MPATTISRATWTDDDGSGTTGTIIGNSRLQADVYDKVDALFSGASAFTFGGTVQAVDANFTGNETVNGYVQTPHVNGPTNLLLDTGGGTGLITLSSRVWLGPYYETKTAPAIVAGVLTLDLAAANHFATALNANISTVTLSNMAPSGTALGWSLVLTADGTPRTITWPAAVKWPGGVAPTPTSTNGQADAYTFLTFNGGTTIYGFVAGQNL